MSASGSAAQRRRAFIERIERLEEDRKALADDIASVYDELKADGHDKAAIKIIVKIRRKEDGLSNWIGHSGTVDEYLADLGMLPKDEETRAGARVRENIEQFPPHDPETGELTDTQEQPETVDDTHERPSINAEAYPEAGPQAEASPAGIGTGTLAGHEGRSEGEAAPADLPTISNPQPILLPGAGKAGDVPPPSSPASSFNNPRCKHPGTCSHAHDQGSCDDCFFAWAKRPLEEQRRLWAEAMEAASETEEAA